MRRVYDDAMYDEISSKIMEVLRDLATHPKDVMEYSYGMDRSMLYKIQNYLIDKLPEIKFGQSVNRTGIGNNAAYEMIYLGDKKEEQIFGVLHLTDDMYGRHICWMSDIDGGNKFNSVSI